MTMASILCRNLPGPGAHIGMRARRMALIGMSLAAAVVAIALATPGLASASTVAPRIDLKVLVLGTSTSATTDPDAAAWQAALTREGVPTDFVTVSSSTVFTASNFSTTAPDGTTPEGKYQAIIESGAALAALSQASKDAMEQYQKEFDIRRVTSDVYPGGAAGDPGFGLNLYTSAGALDGQVGQLTTAGKAVFPYLNGSVKMDTGTFGYEATPISTTNFNTLVTLNGYSLAGIYTHADGVQELVTTFNENANQLQAFLLRHGVIAWATRGVYFGDQRNYLETHIDDNFLSDDAWSITGNATTPAHSTDFNPADALREVPADVTTAAAWSKLNNFRIDMLFNGGGSVAVANGSSLVGTGDSGSGGTGSTGGTGGTATGQDSLLAAFQATDPGTAKPYTSDFGWISHTWDHPNVDEGCATQNFIEAELNQNTNWGAAAAKTGDPINGGLGLTLSTNPSDAFGAENPNVIVVGEHSGIANLLPGNPGQVDPPSLDQAAASTTTPGTLAAGSYVYAVTDQFNTAAPGATPVAAPGESAASVSSAVTVTGTESVGLSWTAVCHAAVYNIYRAPWTGTAPGAWSLIGTVPANTATDFTDPTGGSTTNSAGGGAGQKTFSDTGIAGTLTGSTGALTATSTPSTAGAAVESAYEQNPVLNAAFSATLDGGIKYFGSDASKPYPNPADGTFATGTTPATTFAAGSSFPDGAATAIPRYPTNIYYNVSTNAQEVDEYQTLYDLPTCKPITGVTTCSAAGTQFPIATIIASVDQGMFQHMMGNDPRPHYFHQTNLMSQPGGGDGLYYETMNPLLAEYSQYFASTAPIQQPTMAQIGSILAEQSAWATATPVSGTDQVTGYIQGNQVTITNSGAATNVPLSGIAGVGSSYGGTQSGWSTVSSGTSKYTALTTWPDARTVTVALTPSSIVANGTSTTTAKVTVTDEGFAVTGDTVTLASSDAASTDKVKIGALTDNKDGTYTATITSSSTPGTVTITATDTLTPANVTPVMNLTATAPLYLTTGPAAHVNVTLSPTSILANGTGTSTATARITDIQNRPLATESNVSFASSDSGEKIGPVTNNGDGTYSATVTSSTTVGTPTITATDSTNSPSVSGHATADADRRARDERASDRLAELDRGQRILDEHGDGHGHRCPGSSPRWRAPELHDQRRRRADRSGRRQPRRDLSGDGHELDDTRSGDDHGDRQLRPGGRVRPGGPHPDEAGLPRG